MRTESVSRPFSTTQALNGDSHGRRAQHRQDLLAHEAARAQHRAAEDAALPVEVLGGRMDDRVGAELQRPLQRRRAEAVVDQRGRRCRDRARPARRCRRSRSADWTAFRRTAAVCGCRPPRARPKGRRVDEAHLDAERASTARKELHRRAEHAGAQTTWSPAFSVARHAARIARHAGRGRDAVLGALERGEALLEHRHRRVGEARIDVCPLRRREARGRLRRVLENEAAR